VAGSIRECKELDRLQDAKATLISYLYTIPMNYLEELFGLSGKTALITGGGGVLAGAIGEGLARAGVNIVLSGRRAENTEANAEKIRKAGGEARATVMDALDRDMIRETCAFVLNHYDSIDILVNAAGGNVAGATIQPGQSVFDMNIDDFERVSDLNYKATVLPTLEVGRIMASQASGSVINISSMAAMRAITRVIGYSAAKAAVANFTQWMAMEMAMKCGGKIRVNAIAPGFFIGDQNRALLTHPDGTPTERGLKVLKNTPMGRFGEANELVAAVLFLASEAASFVTGVILPVDGGFNFYSGV
jgi:NAD(P)-dependent dehydrogenase (short-subunit alcohol dehydrogenase family)